MAPTQGLNFAIFCRVSTRDQAISGESLQTQEARLRDIVKGLGGTVVRVVAQPEHATPGHEHAALVGLINDAKNNQFDALIVNDSTRFSRDAQSAYPARQALRKARVRLFYGTSEQDLMTPEGEAMAAMAAVFDEFTVAKLRDQASATRIARFRRGWPHSNNHPFARRLVISANASRTDATACWELDPEKHALVLKMYDLYVHQDLPFTDVGKIVEMNPETVRRILVNQSGPTWTCNFNNRRTDTVEKVTIDIPRLLTDDEIARVRAKAAHNQVAREKWVRKREYILRGYVRCFEEGCGCANLSGHQSLGNPSRKSKTGGPLVPKSFPYYIHRTKGRLSTCAPLVPAAALEASVISNLSRLLNNKQFLRDAIAAARPEADSATATLITRRANAEEQLARAHKVQERAAAALLGDDMIAFTEKVRSKVRDAEALICSLASELEEIDEQLARHQVTEPALIDEMLLQFESLNGASALQWPPHLQRKLLKFFFGPISTRHLRDGVGVRSLSTGIFVKRCFDEETGLKYFTYVAKGRLGFSLTGGWSEYEYLDQRMNTDGALDPLPAAGDLAPIVHALRALKGTPWFRESPQAFIRGKW